MRLPSEGVAPGGDPRVVVERDDAVDRRSEDRSSTLKALLRILGALLVLAGVALIVRAARKRHDGDREARPTKTLRARARQAV